MGAGTLRNQTKASLFLVCDALHASSQKTSHRSRCGPSAQASANPTPRCRSHTASTAVNRAVYPCRILAAARRRARINKRGDRVRRAGSGGARRGMQATATRPPPFIRGSDGASGRARAQPLGGSAPLAVRTAPPGAARSGRAATRQTEASPAAVGPPSGPLPRRGTQRTPSPQPQPRSPPRPDGSAALLQPPAGARPPSPDAARGPGSGGWGRGAAAAGEGIPTAGGAGARMRSRSAPRLRPLASKGRPRRRGRGPLRAVGERAQRSAACPPQSEAGKASRGYRHSRC